MQRYTDVVFPPKYVEHKIETHPEIKKDIKAIAHTLEPMERLSNNWRSNTMYLFGVDLFNAAFYWETHEVFEGLWRLEEKGSPTYNGLKGLIQLATSTLKHDRDEPKGRDLLLIGGSRYLRDSDMDQYGVNIEFLISAIEAYQSGGSKERPIITI